MSYRCHIDFETRSICDLRTRGDQMYAQHFSTAPIMLAFISPHAKGVFDFMQDKRYANSLYPVHEEFGEYLNSYAVPLPTIIRKAIDDDAIFVAHNARFEQSIYYWICHRRWGWPMPRRWSCTAARARYWGLRASLYGVGEDLEIENKKLATEGADFIKTFCIPRQYRGAKKNGNIATLWAEPDELPNEWKKGVEYCLVDAEAEKEVDGILPDLPPFEQAVWDLDFKMNTRGLPIDVENVYKAMAFSEHYTQVGQIRFNAITGGLNPTQRDRVLEYLNAREETLDLPNLRTKTLQRVSQADMPEEVRDVIHLRLEAARASVKKLEAMKNGVSDDGFARGLFLYYGAHTGRFTAKRIQPHNYVRGDPVNSRIMFDYLADPCWTKGLDNQGVPQWVRLGDLLFPRPLGVLSKAMRGFIKAPDGKRFVIGDYAQIEARVLAWLARCTPLLESFKASEDVYVRFAADHMYSRPYEDYFDEHGRIRPEYKFERQCAKSAVLGAGFGLGAEGFRAYCDASDIILSEEEAEKVIQVYRAAVPEIADYRDGLWKRVGLCAIMATENEREEYKLWGTDISFKVHRLSADRYWLVVTLPSGRHIAYYRPKLDTVDRWNRPQLSFRTEWNGKTYREQTYGGRLTENIVQAVARDICMQGALNAEDMGFTMIGTVHDELLTLVDLDANVGPDQLKAAMLDRQDWYTDLPMNGEALFMDRYGSH